MERGFQRSRRYYNNVNINVYDYIDILKIMIYVYIINCEINLLGCLSPEQAKARWKYLRDNYTKTRKKIKSYIPSGSGAEATIVKKSKFRFYDLMMFLSDFLETRQ